MTAVVGQVARPTSLSDADALALLRGMLEIPSPSHREQRLATFVVEAMRGLGFTAGVDAAGNAVGELRHGPGPTVMLLGHLDTVDGEIAVVHRDGRLYGRGAVDAKGPLAAMICAAATTAFAGRVVVVGATEEETPLSRGAVAIRDTHDRPDALIIGEPSGWSGIVLGYKGKLDLHYHVRGAPAHPTSPATKATERV